jgi:CrcB protein
LTCSSTADPSARTVPAAKTAPAAITISFLIFDFMTSPVSVFRLDFTRFSKLRLLAAAQLQWPCHDRGNHRQVAGAKGNDEYRRSRPRRRASRGLRNVVKSKHPGRREKRLYYPGNPVLIASRHVNSELIKRLALLSLGGALGTLARYGLNGLVSQRVATFPLGTMVVNVTGCFAVGFLAAVSGPAMGRAWFKPEWRDFLMIGFCGGYTTFSSYGIQTLNLARDSEWLAVAGNVLGSNVLGLVAVYLGWVLGRFIQAKFHGGTM